ncbi:Dihydrolipoyllysine-residue succinyltransferase component of 2-oxoglutarate dehydrogenase complex, mitochondrial [Strongyloides ratti]|uniref:Dihydrolipoyllysine-residue succinyltransferase component of 2-oxoglutarate dehydrogenase complex, mitochondrial n=1 Tax=Strongyloides ratti TaxID=34506 RepID=A0A090L7J1_STRRB|nr:Dihydrolipoyllysine-residue succinyltransferase component of 2-oxoglutarate dehydrogenase complex, mitochondrial [Strongyloides ratti]CEF64103.1 Dihydrolipoyllysine-residue succinyltransferase component of 2-oxoglutarate dehydrogenase complex, mitochondrial [Strongyloides ratti]
MCYGYDSYYGTPVVASPVVASPVVATPVMHGKSTMSYRSGFAKTLRQISSISLKSTRPLTIRTLTYFNKNLQLSNTIKPVLYNEHSRNIHLSPIFLSETVVIEGPAFAESISEGDIRWIKAVGDFVNEDDLVAEIETDKTSVEVPAPRAGTIVKFLVQDGEKVGPKQKLYELQPGNASDTAPASKKEEAPVKEKAAPTKKEEEPKEVKNIQDTFVKSNAGTIPKSAPITSKPSSTPMSSVNVSGIEINKLPSGVTSEQSVSGSREEFRVKMNRMRLRTAERLKNSQNENASLTTFNEIDMSNVMEMRSKYQQLFTKKHGIKLGLMSPFIKASAYALTNQPIVNAVIDQGDIVYRKFIDISVAVATPKGLVVPVIRNVEGMNYADIEYTLFKLGEKARENKIAVEDMEGGTFTISNGGVYGSLFGTPIINPPQCAILGMHGIFDKPVAVNGKVEIRPIMTVALTYDHRLIDGREAVTFLKTIKSSVEDPRVMLMNL